MANKTTSPKTTRWMYALALGLASTAINPICAQNATAPVNLLSNGDFDAESPASPPTGWAMWGQERWKNPQNYTRDTTQAHAGPASLRIFRPANTGGYLASFGQVARVQTRPGMTYDFSFWAKTDKAGVANFGVQSVRELTSFDGAGGVMARDIDVTPEWKQFRYQLSEGIDFSADTARYLFLTFSAVSQGNSREATLWIDDVSVTESPIPPELRPLVPMSTLVNPDSLPYTPVNHRLTPGETLNITADANRIMRRATKEATGVSFHRMNGYMGLPYDSAGKYRLTPAQEEQIRALQLPGTRTYGLGAEEKFPLNDVIDNAASTFDRTGIPQENSVLEFESQYATPKIEPAKWAEGVRHSRQKGYKFRYWEVSNEPYFSKGGIESPDDYARHVNAVSDAIRGAAPDGKVGVQIFGIAENPSQKQMWDNYVLKATAGKYDFAVAHWYALIDVSKNSFESIVAAENYRVLDQVARTNALLKAYNPGRDVYQYDTEWSLHSSGSTGNVINTNQNGNIVGAMHRAIRLIYYTREDLVRGASAWEMFSHKDGWNSLALLPPDGEKTSMNYWVHRLFNQHLGESVLEMSGTAPFYTPPADAGKPSARPLPGPLTPAIVTLSKDKNTAFVVVANASWSKEIPFSLALKNFKVASVSGQKISNDDPNRVGLLDRKEDFVSDFTAQWDGTKLSATLPAHSVVFLRLTRAGA